MQETICKERGKKGKTFLLRNCKESGKKIKKRNYLKQDPVLELA